jgi:uncharacterized protein
VVKPWLFLLISDSCNFTPISTDFYRLIRPLNEKDSKKLIIFLKITYTQIMKQHYFIQLTLIFGLLLSPLMVASEEQQQNSAQIVYTPYSDEPKALFEFYFDEPNKIHAALFWIRSYINTLMAEPYGLAPEFMSIIVIIHGTEIVTVAKKNYPKYKTIVDRMRYYEQLGVEFRVCMDAADDYGYKAEDFHSFIKMAPSAMVEIAHWQSMGYPLIRPIVYEKKYSIEEIR